MSEQSSSTVDEPMADFIETQTTIAAAAEHRSATPGAQNPAIFPSITPALAPSTPPPTQVDHHVLTTPPNRKPDPTMPGPPRKPNCPSDITPQDLSSRPGSVCEIDDEGDVKMGEGTEYEEVKASRSAARSHKDLRRALGLEDQGRGAGSQGVLFREEDQKRKSTEAGGMQEVARERKEGALGSAFEHRT